MISTYFARYLAEKHPNKEADLETLFFQLSEAIAQGSSCLNLRSRHGVAGKKEEEWRAALKLDEEGSVAGSEGANTPLILSDNGLLYMQRYYEHEHAIAKRLLFYANKKEEPIKAELQQALALFFDKPPAPNVEDLQKKAALTALKYAFCLISGGPGTGKTTTVVKILSLLKLSGAFALSQEVLMLAPTGKAADRLAQSIQSGVRLLREQLPQFSTIFDALPQSASTIHRALGYRPQSLEFKYGEKKPLPHKIIVVDEASMVGLPLMRRLLQAIHTEARIVFLGDKHQLISVEVGSVLADVTQAAETKNAPLQRHLVTLQHTYRNAGSIKASCDAIKAGNAKQAYAILEQEETPESKGTTKILPLPSANTIGKELKKLVLRHWLPILQNQGLSAEEKLQGLDHFRILCPSNEGTWGREAMNAWIERILSHCGIETEEEWYVGRSVMLQQNDHYLQLYNGDVGLVTQDEVGQLKVIFKQEKGIKSVSPAQLPQVKSAWALTVHKTQGSEYQNILMILPKSEDGASHLSRELLYTGISRAKEHVTIWGDAEDFQEAVKRRVLRASGLSHQLLSYF